MQNVFASHMLLFVLRKRAKLLSLTIALTSHTALKKIYLNVVNL